MSGLTLSVQSESWPIAGGFTISRGTKHDAKVVVVTVGDGTNVGRGECVPYGRYGETIDSVLSNLDNFELPPGNDAEIVRAMIQKSIPAGAARNALDCALWDLEAKQKITSCAALAGVTSPVNVTTAHTIGLASPDVMAAKAQALEAFPILKLKLDGSDLDGDRMNAVRNARPDGSIIVDANEAWTNETLVPLLKLAALAKVALVEQPLAARSDQILSHIEHDVPIFADESAHTAQDIASLRGRYDGVNIKLDKTGGLTQALAMVKAARASQMQIMVGSMVATSLSMAPAMIIAQGADWVDLDGPLLLSQDRQPALQYDDAIISPPSRALWG